MMSLMTVAGPGTGVSPFIGFLQHLEALKQQQQRALGHSFLFFGCRNSREFLFQQQLEHWAKGGVLAGLWVAFSRPGTEHCRNAADAAAAAGSIGTLSLSASFDETRSGQYVQHIIAQQKQVTRARLLAAAH
jgi:sulfite reductase alpha subunit-like flavoprotein